MKALRIAYYIIFTLSALISINLIVNSLRRGFNIVTLKLLIIALVIVAVQTAGLIVVILDRNRILSGIFAVASGIATLFAGGLAFSTVGAPAPRHISDISITSMFASYYILAAYVVVGVLFIIMQFKNSKINGAEN